MTRDRFVHIGLPKAASTYLQNYFHSHPQIYCEFVKTNALAGTTHDAVAVRGSHRIPEGKVPVFTNEKLSESMIMTGSNEVWQRCMLVPGKWDEASPHFRIDHEEAAARIKRSLGANKVLIVIRNQIEWLQSVYKYYLVRLPPKARSFADFCDTPRGRVYLLNGHFERLIGTYSQEFGASNIKVMRVEDLSRDAAAFTRDLCDFLGVEHRPALAACANESSTNYAALVRRYWPATDLLPGPIRKFGSAVMERLLPERSAVLSDAEIEEIRVRYADSRRALETLLNRHNASPGSADADSSIR